MTTLADAKYTALTAQGYSGTLNGMEWEWLSDQTGRTDLTLNGQWYVLLTGMGYSGAIQDMQLESWIDLGASPESWNDAAYWFWNNGGQYIINPAGYLLLETGVDKLILEDGTGFLLLEG
jgi:hypothetical protein